MEPSYNDSFGQGDSGGTGIISSGDAGGVAPATPGNSRSDIILSSSNSGGGNGGKRRPLIIAMVILFVMLVAVGVLAWISSSSSFGGDYGGGLVESFDKYADYVLYGESREEPVGKYDGRYDYFFKKIVKDMDNEKLELVAKYQNTFGANVKSEEEGDLNVLLKEQKDYLGYIRQVMLKGDVELDDLVPVYVGEGRAKTKEKFESYYGDINSDNAYLQEFIDDYKTWLGLELDYLDFYDSKGCIIDDLLNERCLFEAETDDEQKILRTLEGDIRAAHRKVIQSQYAVENYIENVFSINKVVNDAELMSDNTTEENNNETDE
ncbi:hypothetical protein IKT18_03980 [Candidatus Saccharibacteria bacterium]|nr:hypothetical protein [Candidatus Saccharibacteria bacterium]